jgi:hypothetical protein
VRSVLDELLYGWLYEVKEFGAAMESEAVQVAESLKK